MKEFTESELWDKAEPHFSDTNHVCFATKDGNIFTAHNRHAAFMHGRDTGQDVIELHASAGEVKKPNKKGK